MKILFAFACSLVFIHVLHAQVTYPFRDIRNENDVIAYWYNVPVDSLVVKAMGQTIRFQSTLEIYGRVPDDAFTMAVAAFLKGGKIAYTKNITVKKEGVDTSIRLQRKGKFFKVILTVPHLTQPPTKIAVRLQSGSWRRIKEIVCRYHELSGRITDQEGKPFKGVVLVRPDDFDSGNGVWSDADGTYRITLPERIYSNIFVDDESYGIRTAEAWGWHIIMDGDQTLDFKVGTGEVYNLNVWPNNGGAKTCFVSFRPMSLPLYQNAGKKTRVTVEGKEYQLIDLSPKLTADDMTIRFNNVKAEIVSVQRTYEWTSGTMMPAYLVQVSREGLQMVGKQTVTVEYRKEDIVDGSKALHASFGVFQFYPNFTGLSFF